MPVSKTDFVRAMQCEKMLWLDSHAPEYKIIPEEIQNRLDLGNAFGDSAMGVFGAFVETTCYKEDGRLDYAQMLKTTQTLLSSGERVICEAAFSWYGNFCAVDILKKDGEFYSLYEVKNTNTVRSEFLIDLGFQRLILRKSGVKVGVCALVLNGEETDESAGQVCVEHDGKRYKIVDVTKEVVRYERLAESRIFAYGKIKRKDAVCPNIGVGEQCKKPYLCFYYEYCHGGEKPEA
jgi:hypothetical protein